MSSRACTVASRTVASRNCRLFSHSLATVLILALAGALFALPAVAQPTLSKVFAPSTIGPGSVSTITFTITNGGGTPVTGLAFSDVLPAAITIADPAVASTNCDLGGSGTLSAPDGGSTITLSDAELGAFSSCNVFVDVTASTPGMHTNPAVTLSSSAGSSMSLAVDLTVDANLPGFSKSFSPSSISLGERSALTFTIDNTLNAAPVQNLDFTDNLPSGMVVADPPNASTTCGTATIPPVLTAEPGTDVVDLDANGNFSFPAVAAGATCTVTVDVIGTGIGMLDNVSGDLLADFTAAGKASDTLAVSVTPLAIQKSFTDDPIAPGGSATLELTITNFDRNLSATDVAFTDDLSTLVPALAGLVFSSELSNDCGGTVSGIGGTTLGLSGASLPAQDSCTVRVSLSVPLSATPGAYTNTTSTVTGTVGGSPVVGNTASDDLFVEPIPIFTKEFIDDPTTGGGTVTLRFTITNTDSASALTGIEFTDDIGGTGFGRGGALPGLAANGLVDGSGLAPDPIVDPCGAGSELTIPDPNDSLPSPALPPDPTLLIFTGGNLAAAGMPGASCTFDVVLDVPAGTPSGSYTNTTSELTATPFGAPPASDDLIVVAAPSLVKEFTDDPVAPGGTATLSFTLSHPPEAIGDATNIAFTDDLSSMGIAGLTASLPPTPDPPCGAGSTLTAPGNVLTLSGGSLIPGQDCTFSVALDIPALTLPGKYTNTTSEVSATVEGLAVTSGASSDVLDVSGLTFVKEFLGDPVIAGESVTLRFTLSNIHPTDAATSIAFSDDLAAVLPGTPDLAAILPPAVNTCGGTMGGTATSPSYSGGSLGTGSLCTVELVVLVPAGTADGAYNNITSSLTANQGGGVTIDPATDVLEIDSNLLQLTKTFTDDPVSPGDPVTLELILTNLDATRSASNVAFTDDLAAALAGLTFDSVPLDTCGGTLTGTGTTMIDLSAVSLAASASCTLRVSLTVPGATTAGVYANTTSDVSGTIGGLPVTGTAASDDLSVIQTIDFSKSFDGPTTATGTATLTFTLTNPGTDAASGLSFSDDLDSVITGLIATSLPGQPCGAGSSITGIGLLTFTGGALDPMETCTFDVEVTVPMTATAGTFPNATSDLVQSGLKVADPATADLVIEPPPTFAKVFAPDFVGLGFTTTLTFTLDNTASALDADNLDFTDNLPAGLTVATPANQSTTCTGGTVTAVSGTSVISYTGGTVGAGAVCTVQTSVVATATGSLVNTTLDLTSTSGNSGTATDTLIANPQPGFAKAFAPDLMPVDGISTLTFTLDNTGSTVDATGLDFTDVLPGDVVVATPAAASTTCTGGTLTAVAGSGSVSYTGGTVSAGTACTVQVDVTAPTAGVFDNESGDLTSSLGNSGTATDTLEAVDTDLLLDKTLVSNPVLPGGTVEVEYTLTNLSADFAATAITFTDDFDAALAGLAATGLPQNDVCGAGSQIAGTSVLTLTGGNLPASGTCTFTVTLLVPAMAAAGTYPGATSTVDGLVDGVAVSTPPASDDLVVAYLVFDKAFAGSAEPGETATLQFTLENPDPVNAATDLAFTDDLDAFIPGATAQGLPQNDVCGVGSMLAGTSLVSLSGGSLPAGGTCTFDVSVLIPGDTAPGAYLNVTSSLEGDVGGAPVSLDPAGAEAELTVSPSPLVIPVLGPGALGLLALFLALAGLRVVRLH